jgi:hypothetical protein
MYVRIPLFKEIALTSTILAAQPAAPETPVVCVRVNVVSQTEIIPPIATVKAISKIDAIIGLIPFINSYCFFLFKSFLKFWKKK